MEEDIRKLLYQNTQDTKAVLAMVKKIKRYVAFQQIFGIVKLVLVLVPIILAIIYGMPLVRQAIGTYQQVIGSVKTLQGTANQATGLMGLFNNLQGNGGMTEEQIKEFLR